MIIPAEITYFMFSSATRKTFSSVISIAKRLTLRSPFHGVTFTVGHGGFVKLNLI